MDDAKILLTAMYDRLALSIESGETSQDELKDLVIMLIAACERLVKARPAKPAAVHPAPNDELIPVPLCGTTTMIRRSSVRFVEAQGDYARLHTKEGSYLLRVPLRDLEARWAGAGFLRVHRSFMISLAFVTEVRATDAGCTVRIGTGEDAPVIPVSRRYTRALRDRLRAAGIRARRLR